MKGVLQLWTWLTLVCVDKRVEFCVQANKMQTSRVDMQVFSNANPLSSLCCLSSDSVCAWANVSLTKEKIVFNMRPRQFSVCSQTGLRSAR